MPDSSRSAGAGRQRAVDERPAASCRRDLAAQQHLGSFRPVEHRFDYRRIFACADELSGCAAADEQPDRADEDGFSRSSFAGQDVEPGFELQLEAIDDGQVADGKEAQHERPSAILSDV